MKTAFSFVFAFAGLFIGGCCVKSTTPRDLLNVKTETMAQVVSAINSNNLKIPTLWAHHYYEADVVDEKKRSHHVSGDGVLLYQTPISMRLVASAAGAGTVFEIGSNPQTFWLKLGPEAGDTMWWGRYEEFARMNPDDAGIPIRPDMVLDVLGIATVNTNFNELPVPTMRFNAEGDAYVFIWNGKLRDRWVALREVWYDRVTKRPRLVLLYDMNGRVVMCATLDLKQYHALPIQGLPKEQWPWTPGDYKLFFPDTGSRLQFTLESTELNHGQNGITVPNPKSFRMPSPENPGVEKVVQIGPHAE